MDPSTRRQLVQKYKEGYQTVAEAVDGASDVELDARPAPEKWSAREIVHHLADSEMTSAIRLRLLLAEDRPAIKGYDEAEFARKLYYDRPIAASLDAFRAARLTTAELLDRMTDVQWEREGTHTAHGRYAVEDWLRIYADHAHNHADQIRRARASARH
jgi:DinB superfamily